MEIVNIHEAKTHLSRLIQRALAGEEIIIAKGGKPMVRLLVCAEAGPCRVLGRAKGLIEIGSDFDEPLGDFGDYQ